MEQWEDQGIVLSVRAHGENGAIVTLLTESNGRHAGYVRGARSTKLRGHIEPGNLVDVRWQARIAQDLGAYTLELTKNYSAVHMSDPLRLAAIQSACALCDITLPEREVHGGLFYGMIALFDMLDHDIWPAAYIAWEIALLRELGFSLDLSKCASGSGTSDLAYVSPKTGRAVSATAGAPYKDKLLILPQFLTPQGGDADERDICNGFALSEYFLEHWAFTHHTQGLPEPRLRLAQRMRAALLKDENEHAHAGGAGNDTNFSQDEA